MTRPLSAMIHRSVNDYLLPVPLESFFVRSIMSDNIFHRSGDGLCVNTFQPLCIVL